MCYCVRAASAMLVRCQMLLGCLQAALLFTALRHAAHCRRLSLLLGRFEGFWLLLIFFHCYEKKSPQLSAIESMQAGW